MNRPTLPILVLLLLASPLFAKEARPTKIAKATPPVVKAPAEPPVDLGYIAKVENVEPEAMSTQALLKMAEQLLSKGD